MESRVLEGIVQGLRARDIAAFPVTHAGIGDDVASVNARMHAKDFSHMPLRNAKGQVVSVLHRGTAAAIPLDRKAHVIKADDPLPVVIKKLPSAGFLLVKSRESGQPDQIAGIINHADVISLPVRLLVYTRTMQLEHRVFKRIAGDGATWGASRELAPVWNKAARRAQEGRDQRSCPEAYLQFRDLMTIGRVRGILGLANAAELDLLCAARNFAAHAVIDLPAVQIPETVERYVSLVERILAESPS